MLHAHDDILDADAELAVLVVAWLIRNAHAWLKLHFIAAADAIRTLVHVQVAANTMASAVLVVEASSPEVLARQDIHIAASNGAISRPSDPLEVECAEKHACIGLFLEGGRFAATEVSRASNIGCAIEILTTRVEKVDFTVIERHASILLGLVVDDCTVGTDRADSVKGWTAMVLTVSTELIEVFSAGVLSQSVALFAKLLIKVSEVFHDCCAIPDVSLAHAFLLDFILFAL